MSFHLQRFVDAQADLYPQVLAELRAGLKKTHWMWFIFPQLEGLGHSATSRHFGISGIDEAKAYLAHPILGPRLLECTSLVSAVFPYPDNLKFRSSMTLFGHATDHTDIFRSALVKFFSGQPDPATLSLLYAGKPFENAVDAIVAGDLATLRKILAAQPDLIHARSTRSHRSTLLHYVSANGVEGIRQFTPPNIVEITEALLEAGADVHAESDAYGGRSTTLGLAATSCHPEEARVQIPLLQLLIDHGARIEGVDACLNNGRHEAAIFLAGRGADLDIESAAGTGRLDLVQTLFPIATAKQKSKALAHACQFGQTEAARYLIDNEVHHELALHWAAWGAHRDIVKLLLERGYATEIKDDIYHCTPVEWATHAQAVSSKSKPWPEVIALLNQAPKPQPQS